MKYSVGDCLADYGFKFFERLHQPIFLMSRLGHVVKVNEAGRKLISVAHTSVQDLEQTFKDQMQGHLQQKTTTRFWLKSPQVNLQLIASHFNDSDYFLVEVCR